MGSRASGRTSWHVPTHLPSSYTANERTKSSMLLSAVVLVVAAASDASSTFDDGREYWPLFTKADTPNALAASSSSGLVTEHIEIMWPALMKMNLLCNNEGCFHPRCDDEIRKPHPQPHHVYVYVFKIQAYQYLAPAANSLSSLALTGAETSPDHIQLVYSTSWRVWEAGISRIFDGGECGAVQ